MFTVSPPGGFPAAYSKALVQPLSQESQKRFTVCLFLLRRKPKKGEFSELQSPASQKIPSALALGAREMSALLPPAWREQNENQLHKDLNDVQCFARINHTAKQTLYTLLQSQEFGRSTSGRTCIVELGEESRLQWSVINLR